MSTRSRRAMAVTALIFAMAGVPTAASADSSSTTVAVSSSSQVCLSNQEGIVVAPGIVICGNFVLDTNVD